MYILFLLVMICYTIPYHTIPYHTILYYTILYYTVYTILYILYYTVYTIIDYRPPTRAARPGRSCRRCRSDTSIDV